RRSTSSVACSRTRSTPSGPGGRSRARLADHPNVWITTVEPAEGSGPLSAMTLAVKDNIDVAGVPTTAACPAYAYTPTVSAPVVQRLVDAGAAVIGKTNLDQFATGLTGTRTPH